MSDRNYSNTQIWELDNNYTWSYAHAQTKRQTKMQTDRQTDIWTWTIIYDSDCQLRAYSRCGPASSKKPTGWETGGCTCTPIPSTGPAVGLSSRHDQVGLQQNSMLRNINISAEAGMKQTDLILLRWTLTWGAASSWTISTGVVTTRMGQWGRRWCHWWSSPGLNTTVVEKR